MYVCVIVADHHRYCNDFDHLWILSASVYWNHKTSVAWNKKRFPKDFLPSGGLNSGWILSKYCVLGATKQKMTKLRVQIALWKGYEQFAIRMQQEDREVFCLMLLSEAYWGWQEAMAVTFPFSHLLFKWYAPCLSDRLWNCSKKTPPQNETKPPNLLRIKRKILLRRKRNL